MSRIIQVFLLVVLDFAGLFPAAEQICVSGLTLEPGQLFRSLQVRDCLPFEGHFCGSQGVQV